MYEEVRKIRDGGKPVVVSMGSLAASGGYYVACGGSRLVANRGTLTPASESYQSFFNCMMPSTSWALTSRP